MGNVHEEIYYQRKKILAWAKRPPRQRARPPCLENKNSAPQARFCGRNASKQADFHAFWPPKVAKWASSRRPRRPHCISPQLPWPRSHAATHEIINQRRWILMGQQEASISNRWEKVPAPVCPASRARPGQVVASAAHSAPLLRLLTK